MYLSFRPFKLVRDGGLVITKTFHKASGTIASLIWGVLCHVMWQRTNLLTIYVFQSTKTSFSFSLFSKSSRTLFRTGVEF